MLLEDDSVQGFFEHKEPIFSVNVHPTLDNLVVTGGGDDKAYLWNFTTGETVHKFEGHKDSVIAVEFSNCGKYLATGGMDGIVQIFSGEDGKWIGTLEGPDEVTWIKWHPKGPVVLVGSNDSTIWMYQIPSGKVMNVFSGHTGSVTCGTFTHDGKKIVTCSEDSSLIVFDPVSTAATVRLNSDDARFHQNIITCLAIHQDNALAITGSTDHSAKLVRISDGEIISSFENHTDSVESVGFCDILPLVATGSVDGTINIWDFTTMRLRQTLNHDDSVIKIQWQKASPYLFSISVDQSVRLWDARNGQLVKQWNGHTDSILSFAISNQGDKVITGSDDGCSLVFKV
ncbi:WD40 repeat-like protein [Neoconidiobolus thromboides FSU 785]|nr:WD40 repeat-like protein [Neoconidiobolus thromboides FSU 785]